MERLVLAFIAFFRILFGGELPVDRLRAVKALPPPPAAPAPAPPEVRVEKQVVKEVVKETVRDAEAEQKARDEGALLLLASLQREGRLLDFLMEKIDGYGDDQVGAAVRGIHAGCKKTLAEALTVDAVLPGAEESAVTLDAGFDAKAIRLTGNVRGSPPFTGTLKHHGWRAKPKRSFVAPDGADAAVVQPAEVEL
jgi:hypothetical protein